jgi:hypothetical protein
MSQKHNLEPWSLEEDKHGNVIITGSDPHKWRNELIVIFPTGTVRAKENAARIVDCVNACAGIVDPKMVIRFMKAIKLNQDYNRLEAKEVFAELDRLKAENEQLKAK